MKTILTISRDAVEADMEQLNMELGHVLNRAYNIQTEIARRSKELNAIAGGNTASSEETLDSTFVAIERLGDYAHALSNAIQEADKIQDAINALEVLMGMIPPVSH